MYKHFTVILLLTGLLFPINSFGQNQTYKLSGYVKDKEEGFELPGATIYIKKIGKGVYSDDNGYYELNLAQDSMTIEVSYLGYNNFIRTIFLNKNTTLDIFLTPEIFEVEEVAIKGDKINETLKKTQMSVVSVSPKEAALLPAFFGEVDLIKTLQLKPGVQSGGEGSSGLYVRGGGPDQNLFLINQTPIYNPNHLFGFFSTFNPEAVENIDLYKGDFPSNYGGRLSSVVDVKMRDGSKTNYKGAGGIGLISSRLTLEGPIVKDKASFLISGRRTYFDLITSQINRLQEDNPNSSPIPGYYFYDLNGQLSWNIGEKDKITISGYLGRDKFSYNSRNTNFDFNWGNTTASTTWSHYYSEKLISDVTVSYTDYDYTLATGFRDFGFTLGSGIKDYAAKTDFTYFANKRHTLKFGGQAIDHNFEIGRFQAGSSDGAVQLGAGQALRAQEFGVYVSDDFIYNLRLRFNAGLRVSGFLSNDEVFTGLEPRLSGSYLLKDNISLKASYARMYQYLHLASNSGASLPTDIWYPSTENVMPQRSDQVALGVQVDILENKYLLSNELYYKNMARQIDFKDGANLFVNDRLEDEFVFGRGWTYGNEIYLEKKSGRTTGWVGYTLSWTWRKFDEINNGNKFPARYDRRHDVSVVVLHKLSKRLNLTGTWIYGTGNAVTLPNSRILLIDIPTANPVTVPVFADRNSFRMPAYHRMDIGLVWKFTPRWGESDLTFSVYNLYNRRNPYFLFIDEVKNEQTQETIKFQGKQVSLFPILPSITYNFRF